MSTNTNAPAIKDAKASHAENVQFATENNLPSLPVTGNTFPIKGLLFVLGGKWDKEQKVWMVPQHNHAAAQAAANKFTKGTAEYAAANPPKAPAPAKVAAPKAQPAKPTLRTAVSMPNRAGSPSNLRVRVETLADVMENVLKQVPEGAAATLIAEAVAKVREAGATL